MFAGVKSHIWKVRNVAIVQLHVLRMHGENEAAQGRMEECRPRGQSITATVTEVSVTGSATWSARD